MCSRAASRVAFNKHLSEFSTVRQDIAQSRLEIARSRALVLKAARELDLRGSKEARKLIAMIKVNYFG